MGRRRAWVKSKRRVSGGRRVRIGDKRRVRIMSRRVIVRGEETKGE